jgi:hypothetical protein
MGTAPVGVLFRENVAAGERRSSEVYVRIDFVPSIIDRRVAPA